MEYKVSPWKHQLTAIERAKELPWFALFFEMGAGKTMTAINILRHKMNERKKLLRTIVFCPPIVCNNWRDEFAMHSKIPKEKVVVLEGSSKQRLKTFHQKAFTPAGDELDEVPGFFITNYEALLMDDLYEAFRMWRPEALIFDESHRLKNYKAKRSKLAEKLANPKGGAKPLTYLLSGSPVLNSPMDLFHPFLIMDGGDTFSKNFFVFRARYFVDKNAGMPKDRYFPNWVVRPGAVDEINRLIFRAGMRVTKEECLDLPEEVAVTIKCGMTAAQAKNYREMKQDFITFVDENVAAANLAIVKALRLMQVTSGFLPLASTAPPADTTPGSILEGLDHAPVVCRYEENPKDLALRELLEEIVPHSKVLVWAVWKENYKAIAKILGDLGIDFVEVHGDVSAAQKTKNVERFKTDPKCRVFVGHPYSGGIGLNLVNAPYSIFYSRTFSLEHFLQARARNHRGGQTEKVTHYDLVCEGTIDELVQKKLVQKIDMSESLLKQIVDEVKLQ